MVLEEKEGNVWRAFHGELSKVFDCISHPMTKGTKLSFTNGVTVMRCTQKKKVH